MNHDDLTRAVVEWLRKNDNWHRAISLDIEIDLGILYGKKSFPLSVTIARRTRNEIEVRSFVLEEETPEDEIRMLGDFGVALEEIKPLTVIGFYSGEFDLPVLSLKLREMEARAREQKKQRPSCYWPIRELVTRAYMLDICDPVRFELARHDKATPKFVKLEHAISHKRFQHLCFMKTKHLVTSRMNQNGGEIKSKYEVIYDLWKNDRKSFEQYVKGDVHDTLLIAEDLFCSGIE